MRELSMAMLLVGCAGASGGPVKTDLEAQPTPTEPAAESTTPMSEPSIPVQYAIGVGEERDAIYDRAEQVVSRAEATAAGLDLADTAGWPEIRDHLVGVAEGLAAAGFHDGALGPGTAMLQPGPYLERIWKAFGFVETTHTPPVDFAEIQTLATAITAEHLTAIDPDIDKWVGDVLPKTVTDGTQLRVFGPPSYQTLVADRIAELPRAP